MRDYSEEELVWQSYLKHPSLEQRQGLIALYEPYVNILAAKLYANRQIQEIEFDEFKQYGMVGLIEALDKFDPLVGVNFKTYASHRIKGAILDGVTKYSEKQQQITLMARLREERLHDALSQMNEAKNDLFTNLSEIAIGLAMGYMLEDTGMYQASEVESHHAYVRTEVSDLTKVLKKLIATLPKAEQQVLQLHYYSYLKFDEISHRMDLSKGRISQIHREAIKKLLRHYDELKLYIEN